MALPGSNSCGSPVFTSAKAALSGQPPSALAGVSDLHGFDFSVGAVLMPLEGVAGGVPCLFGRSGFWFFARPHLPLRAVRGGLLCPVITALHVPDAPCPRVNPKPLL